MFYQHNYFEGGEVTH